MQYAEKVISNSRQKTGKKIGGQEGHAKKKLERFDDSEVTPMLNMSRTNAPNANVQTLKTQATW